MVKTSYFAGGCFWCITPFFKIYGADSVVSGYSGGDEPNPSYEDVKHQRTGHRETVAVTYDDARVSYQTLLEIYLENVDPWDGSGQFIDRGRSYTLAIYYRDEAERKTAEAALRTLAAENGKQPEVALEPFKFFCPAEEHHQDYYLKHPEEFARELESSGRTAAGIDPQSGKQEEPK